jgi:hypothetical protein
MASASFLSPAGGQSARYVEVPLALLLEVVADYKRLSAMQAASRAGQRRVAAQQYPGVILWLGRAIVPVDAIALGEAPPEWN